MESTKGYSYTVRESRQYPGLSRNDPYLVPKTIEKDGRTYRLEDVKWSGGSENSVAEFYTADATYIGTATGEAPDGYLATATYTGQVTKETPGNLQYTLIYEPVPAPVIAEPESSIDWIAILWISVAVLGAAALVALAVFLVKKYGLFSKKRAVYHPDYEPEARPARRKPHALGYMKRDGGTDNA